MPRLNPADHIRIATTDDVDDLVRMTFDFILTETPYPGEPEDDAVRAVLSDLVTRKPTDSIVLVSTQDNRIVGMIAGVAVKNLFNSQRCASEQVWWVDPEFRRGTRGKDLAEAYSYWAEHVAKCDFEIMSSVAGPKQAVVDKYYARKGFVKTETAHLREF